MCNILTLRLVSCRKILFQTPPALKDSGYWQGHNTKSQIGKHEALLILLKCQFVKNIMILYTTSIFILASRPQKPNYPITAKNNRGNPIYGYSTIPFENKRNDIEGFI